VRIDIAYGGSCTAGKREDFDHYHAVLAWGRGRSAPAAEGAAVRHCAGLFLQYGTTAVRDYCIAQGYDRTFAAAGARILQPIVRRLRELRQPGSSTDAGQVTVSAINRNFPGRCSSGRATGVAGEPGDGARPARPSARPREVENLVGIPGTTGSRSA
jgi:3-isopropylmalate/(R)-2-methylmalate dehydratase large subunit